MSTLTDKTKVTLKVLATALLSAAVGGGCRSSRWECRLPKDPVSTLLAFANKDLRHEDLSVLRMIANCLDEVRPLNWRPQYICVLNSPAGKGSIVVVEHKTGGEISADNENSRLRLSQPLGWQPATELIGSWSRDEFNCAVVRNMPGLGDLLCISGCQVFDPPRPETAIRQYYSVRGDRNDFDNGLSGGFTLALVRIEDWHGNVLRTSFGRDLTLQTTGPIRLNYSDGDETLDALQHGCTAAKLEILNWLVAQHGEERVNYQKHDLTVPAFRQIVRQRGLTKELLRDGHPWVREMAVVLQSETGADHSRVDE